MGDRAFCRAFPEECGALVGDLVLIQDGGESFRKDFWVHFSTLERTQVFTGICGIHFIVIQINTLINLGHGLKKANSLILRVFKFKFQVLLFLHYLHFCFAAVKTTFLNVADVTYGML